MNGCFSPQTVNPVNPGERTARPRGEETEAAQHRKEEEKALWFAGEAARSIEPEMET